MESKQIRFRGTIGDLKLEIELLKMRSWSTGETMRFAEPIAPPPNDPQVWLVYVNTDGKTHFNPQSHAATIQAVVTRLDQETTVIFADGELHERVIERHLLSKKFTPIGMAFEEAYEVVRKRFEETDMLLPPADSGVGDEQGEKREPAKPTLPKRPGKGASREDWYRYKYACDTGGVIKFTHAQLGEAISLTEGTARNYYSVWRADASKTDDDMTQTGDTK